MITNNRYAMVLAYPICMLKNPVLYTCITSVLAAFWGPPARLALITVALLGIYQSVGTAMVYYYAGLKGIDTNLHEAAKVDGCTGAQVFFHITLPLLRPTMAYVLIILFQGELCRKPACKRDRVFGLPIQGTEQHDHKGKKED